VKTPGDFDIVGHLALSLRSSSEPGDGMNQWRSHTSGVRGVRTPCQENTYFFGM